MRMLRFQMEQKQGSKPELRANLVLRSPGEGRRLILVEWVGASWCSLDSTRMA